MKALRPAFTIIEVLISVIILSFAIIFVLQVHTDNQEQIVYISERNKLSLQDSLYLSPDVLSHHKGHKTAYDVLEKFFKIDAFKSREILKKSSRDIFIPEEITLIPPQDESTQGQPAPAAIINEVMLKDKHSSIYYHFKLESF